VNGEPVTGEPATRELSATAVTSRLRRERGPRTRRRWPDDRGAQLAEFALALPLLVVFVVGIFDFSGAFTLKQKLTNVAQDAARVAAADPANDVPSSSTTVPASVADAYQLIANYFTANKLNLCGLTLSSGAVHASPAMWTYTASGSGCPTGGITIKINRGYYFPEILGTQPATIDCTPQPVGGQAAVIGTCVSIQYGYAWRFGRVASLLGSTTALPATLSATAVAMNEN
jgi:TadE-like protein